MATRWDIDYQVSIKGKWYARSITFITKAVKQTDALRRWLQQMPNQAIQIDKFTRK